MESSEARIAAWVEKNLGEKVSAVIRQERWRPAWFVTIASDLRERQLYIRGVREISDPGMIDVEAKILRVLEENGLLVPHVYGICDEPYSIVMEWLPGRADLSTAFGEEERESVLDHYIELLVNIHGIPTSKFAENCLEMPEASSKIPLGLFNRICDVYQLFKSRPDPMVEFGIGWVRRNTPVSSSQPTLVVGDPGQFLFDKGKVTGILDLELAYVGDRYHDLGGLRLRDMSEPLGDLRRAFRYYSTLTDKPIDAKLIEFHTAQFALVTPMGLSMVLSNPLATPDGFQNIEWYYQVGLMALEAIGFSLGIRFDSVELPPAEPIRHAEIGKLVSETVSGLAVDSGHPEYARGQAARLASYLYRLAELGPAVDRLEQEEVSALAGYPVRTVEEADVALEKLILADDGTRDIEFVTLLHRRCIRHLLILQPL